MLVRIRSDGSQRGTSCCGIFTNVLCGGSWWLVLAVLTDTVTDTSDGATLSQPGAG